MREDRGAGGRVEIAVEVIGPRRQARRVPTVTVAAGRDGADLDPLGVAPGAGRVVGQADPAATGSVGVGPVDGNRLPCGVRSRCRAGKRKLGAASRAATVIAEVRWEKT